MSQKKPNNTTFVFGVVTNNYRAFVEYKEENNELLNSLKQLFDIDIKFLQFDTPMNVKGINTIIGYTVIYPHGFIDMQETIVCIKQRLLNKKELNYILYET